MSPSYAPGLLRAAQLLARAVLPRLFRLELRGDEHVPRRGPVILAANHSGFLDGPLVVLLAPRPLRTLAKAELYRGPLAGLLQLAGQIPVRRGRPDRRALRAALSVLSEGDALGLFPEGTRGTGRLEQVQHGVAWLALRAQCPVVPVACLGTQAALPRGRRMPRLGSPIVIAFGPPVTVAPRGDPRARATVATAAEEIRLALAAHLRATEQRRAA